MKEAKFQDFHTNLVRYVNGGCFSQSDIMTCLFSKTIPFKKNSLKITRSYQILKRSSITDKQLAVVLEVKIYEGNNRYVLEMMQYLEKHVKDDLFGAYVHGSLGSNEEIPYSDFDALVILKDEVSESPKRLAKVAKHLSDAGSIIFDFDPLQHHGWFVLTEADLKYYPEYYFPLELFAHAKSLFHDKGLKLTVHIQNSSESKKQAFNDLSNSIIKRIAEKKYPKNMYQLKGLLSEFMLLPAYYVQARGGKGIYKKFSFDAARRDFLDEDWSIMDEVSLLREQWSYDISLLQKWLLTRRAPISRFLARYYAPVIPTGMKKTLTDDFYHRIQHLALLMQKNLQ